MAKALHTTSGRPPREILIVEDDPNDALLLKHAFQRAELPHQLRFVPDGLGALQFVLQEGPYAAAPRPDLILLDLNLPGMHGHDVLVAIKANVSLRQIPVVVMSSSPKVEDVDRAYGNYANSYIVKPFDLARLVNVVQGLDQFWFGTVTLHP